ncbi:MAG: 2-C-methyl-D-erythritol 4-phosphate cytidylyltransferase [Paracoccaceae bacterium]
MENDKKIAVVIVAGGTGDRVGGKVNKQWKIISGKPVLDWTISKFKNHSRISQIILVLKNADQFKDYKKTLEILKIVPSGTTRTKSVLNGLLAVSKDTSYVLIHDAARPCVSKTLISRVISELEFSDAVIPVMEITDSLWRITSEKENFKEPCIRENFRTTQTPQGFNYKKILDAHKKNETSTTDDTALAIKSNMSITTVEGDLKNIKITFQSDFELAKMFLEN